MNAANETRTLTEALTASLAAVPASRRSALSAHSRHAWRVPASLATIGEPAQWIEPQLSRDDALSEAKRIAEESAAGCGWAWEFAGRWYAAQFRPNAEIGFGSGGVTELVTVETRGGAA